MTTTAAPIRVHIQNQASDEPAFQFTTQQWADACGRAPDLAARLHATIGATEADLAAALPEVELFIGSTGVIKAAFPAAAPRLRWIFATSAGLDRLAPYDWVPPDVELVNNSGIHAEKAGEFGIMALLMLNARLPLFATQQRQQVYRKVFSPSIRGRTLVIVGLGDMGAAVARRAAAFGLRVIGVRRSPAPHPDCVRVVGPAELDAVLPEADFVVVATPLTPETRGLLSRARLDLMKPGAGLVNIARGAVVDQEALCDKLDAGELSGAVLDVFVPEPVPPGARLWTTRNLVMVPHVSSDDPETYNPLSLDLFFRNLASWLDGRGLPNAIDLERGY